MRKKLILSILVVLTLLLLMPTIPAIQHKTIEDKTISELTEQIDFKVIKELMDSGKLARLKHPLLYIFIVLWLNLRMIRANYLGKISSHFEKFFLIIDNEFFFARALWLYISVEYMIDFWIMVSDSLGWKWENLDDLIIGQNYESMGKL